MPQNPLTSFNQVNMLTVHSVLRMEIYRLPEHLFCSCFFFLKKHQLDIEIESTTKKRDVSSMRCQAMKVLDMRSDACDSQAKSSMMACAWLNPTCFFLAEASSSCSNKLKNQRKRLMFFKYLQVNMFMKTLPYFAQYLRCLHSQEPLSVLQLPLLPGSQLLMCFSCELVEKERTLGWQACFLLAAASSSFTHVSH